MGSNESRGMRYSMYRNLCKNAVDSGKGFEGSVATLKSR